jgi:transcriptional regulator with XRE-family HTH domain
MEANKRLHQFLRARREALTPPDVGLPWDVEGRRVRGLRREEVARLAGVSVDYYTRLEQGRTRNVSDQVLDAVADALRLEPLEGSHLHTLAHPGAEHAILPKRRRVRPSVQIALDALGSSPAYVRDIRMNVLGSNAMWRNLFRDLSSSSPHPNIARWTFLDPRSREVYPEWELVAREIVDTLQGTAAKFPSDPDLVQLIGELNIASKDFAKWWSDRRVFQRSTGAKRIRNSVVGEIALNYDAFGVVANDEQVMVIYTAPAGSPADEQLHLLASWNAEAAVDDRAEGRAVTPIAETSGDAR